MAFRSFLSAAGLAFIFSGVALAAERPVIDPGWRASSDVRDFVPERAMRMGVSGWARVRCLVGEDGQGKSCIVVGESPAGYDFGKAALRIIARGQFDAMARGQTTVGRIVVKKLSFSVGNNAAPETWARQPRSKEIASAHPSGAETYGMADVACRTIADDGALAGCSVQDESPPDQGFGAAALSLAKDYRKDASALTLKVGFWVNWAEPGSNVLPPGTQLNLAGPRTTGSHPVPEPIVTVFDPLKPGGVVKTRSEIFIAMPEERQIEAARPSGLTGSASVGVKCEVKPDGAMANCTTSPYQATDQRYITAAISLLPLYRYSQAEIALFQAEPKASYHVNWEP